MARCPICKAPHASCGPATTMPGVDQRVQRKEANVGNLKRYETEVKGTKTTLLLSDEDAKTLGLVAEVKPAGKSAPTNKATKPAATK